MQNPTEFRGLPIQDFFNRRLKAPLPEMGVCSAVLVGLHKGKMILEIKRSGVPERYQIDPKLVSPNWPENQDLKARLDALESGGVNMGQAFEAAETAAPEVVAPTPVVVAASPKPPQAATAVAATQDAWALRVNVPVDGDMEAFMREVASLKSGLEERKRLESVANGAQKALEEWEHLLRDQIKQMQAKGISVDLGGYNAASVAKTRPSMAGIKRPSRAAKATERYRTFVANLKDLMEPGRHYHIIELAELMKCERSRCYHMITSAIKEGFRDVKMGGKGQNSYYYT